MGRDNGALNPDKGAIIDRVRNVSVRIAAGAMLVVSP